MQLRKLKNPFLLSPAWLVAFVERAWGCSVCMGDAASPMIHGMNAGVLFLLGVVGFVLASFASFFFYLWWRSHHPLEADPRLELTTNKG